MRRIAPMVQRDGKAIIDGRELVNLASNDYLGLGQDSALRDEFMQELECRPELFSSSGSPLLTGAHESWLEAVKAMEDLCPGRCALPFNSGYDANCGVIRALAAIPGTLVLADKLSHASIIDGMTAGGSSRIMRFAHNDAESLRRLVDGYGRDYDRILVATESVFSMDGDVAPLKDMAEIKKSNPKISLYVDEAHGFTVFGPEGRGKLCEMGLGGMADFVLCTCGKGLGSEGAFLLCSEAARSYFINTARPLIFSTAISPVSLAHTAFMLKKARAADDRRQRLMKIAGEVHAALKECGLADPSTTQIVPYILGENEKAVEAAGIFRENGFLAMPVRHPSVPKGTARLRLSLSASLKDGDVERLCGLIRRLSGRAA
ncbi:MAG: aminotransferase class I/II-fold pyridoxal phosphate-dependent enzyme [Succinivibrio sp.]